MHERILVTGGAGFVGAALAIAFKNRHPETEVIAFDNLRRRGSELNLTRLRDHAVGFVHGDVRSAEDWQAGHARGARHLERGAVELEIEEQIPDLDQRIICYCGGGSRSALVAESLQMMGYRNVRSLAGGFRAWQEAGLPSE